MSVANHKKSENEIERNSLIRESVDLISSINPRFLCLKMLLPFGKQDVLIKRDIVQIGTMITEELSDRYLIPQRSS